MAGHGIADADSDPAGVAVPSPDPDPAEAVALAEVTARLLDGLGDPELRQVAVWRLEGYTVAEIAALMGKAVATAERKLHRIRDAWAGPGDA